MGTDPANRSAVSQEQGKTLERAETIDFAANESIFDHLPRPVRILELNRGAERIIRDGEANKRDELWLGSAFDEDKPQEGDVPVYIRVANPMPVVAELLCAVIGRALRLPVPEPFVIVIAPGALPDSRMLHPKERHLAFASRDVGGATFSQLLRADSDSARTMLMRWEHVVPVATFDEWVANRDRNLGNILFVANVLWLIDHAEAFHGSSRGLFDLDELVTLSNTNVIGDFLARLSIPECAKHLDSAKEWLIDVASHVNISDALACAELDHWQSQQQKEALSNFLIQRLNLTHSLLCNRMRHPQLPQ